MVNTCKTMVTLGYIDNIFCPHFGKESLLVYIRVFFIFMIVFQKIKFIACHLTRPYARIHWHIYKPITEKDSNYRIACMKCCLRFC